MIGWASFDLDVMHRVGDQVHDGSLCGVWLRQALIAANEVPELERIVLTVDSGASDTVVPRISLAILE